MKKIFMYALIGILVLIGSVLYLENFNYHKLHSAVRDNNTIEVEKLLKKRYFSLNRTYEEGGWYLKFFFDGGTPLELACQNSNYKIVKLLIENGADPKANRPGLFSPLYYTVEEYHKDDFKIVKLLIENGADPDGISIPMDEFSGINYSTHVLLELALTNVYNQDMAKDIKETYMYLEQFVKDDNPIGLEGENCLMMAVLGDNLMLIEYLINEKRVEVNKGDFAKRNCLFYILPEKNYGEKEKIRRQTIVDFLYSAGVDFSKKNKEGKTAYDIAVEEEDLFLAGLIKEKMVSNG